MNRLTKTLLTVCTIASLLPLSACQSTGTPKATVNNYLKTLSGKDIKASQDYQCWQGEAKELPIELPTIIRKWEVTGEQDETGDKDPDSHYKLVSARIESLSVGGFPVTKTWNFEVWKSDEFYENSKRYYDSLNQSLDQGNKAVEQMDSILGSSRPELKPKFLSPPDRTAVSSKLYCVSVVKPVQ